MNTRAHPLTRRAPTGPRRFERTRSACGPAGLFAEEYDVAQRQDEISATGW
ncbi:hypothetical protein ACIQVT_20405 [Streptomyces sp. NPDC100445]|uniref:hypothetical protein n=1 Tax=Streptomyces sp. NPDC100445 TaxID=3366102 RepID=UPI0038209189